MANIRRSLETRRGDVERSRAVSGGVFNVDGIIELTGIGEATVEVRFPVTFTELPLVLGGGAVAENQAIIPTEFPRWNVGVLRWNTVIDPDLPDEPTYIGCTLIVIVDGARSQADTFQSYAFWSARGRALTNPTNTGL